MFGQPAQYVPYTALGGGIKGAGEKLLINQCRSGVTGVIINMYSIIKKLAGGPTINTTWYSVSSTSAGNTVCLQHIYYIMPND